MCVVCVCVCVLSVCACVCVLSVCVCVYQNHWHRVNTTYTLQLRKQWFYSAGVLTGQVQCAGRYICLSIRLSVCRCMYIRPRACLRACMRVCVCVCSRSLPIHPMLVLRAIRAIYTYHISIKTKGNHRPRNSCVGDKLSPLSQQSQLNKALCSVIQSV